MDLHYTVEIKTGNRSDAGTDANVYIQIIGDLGTTERVHLDHTNHNDFERGNLDRYQIGAKESIGIPEEVYICHDNSGSGSGWFLDWVKVTDPVTGKQHQFDCYQWLAKNEGDGKIERTLFPKEGKPKPEFKQTGRENIRHGVDYMVVDWRDAVSAPYKEEATFSVTNAKNETGEQVNSSEQNVSTEVNLEHKAVPISAKIAVEIKESLQTRSQRSKSQEIKYSHKRNVEVKPGHLMLVTVSWMRIDEVGYVIRGGRQFPYRLTVDYMANSKGEEWTKEQTLPAHVVAIMEQSGMRIVQHSH